jgi:PTH2 family peptidyl-tRNA hydrolase
MENIDSTSTEDPIMMYLIVNSDLNMSIGKTAAQVGHAVQLLIMKYYSASLSSDLTCFSDQYKVFDKWLQSKSYRKVVLRANFKEWNKVKEEFITSNIITSVMVIDAGFTELEPNSNTVIGLFPIFKSQAPKTIKRLQLLK